MLNPQPLNSSFGDPDLVSLHETQKCGFLASIGIFKKWPGSLTPQFFSIPCNGHQVHILFFRFFFLSPRKCEVQAHVLGDIVMSGVC